MNDLVSLWTGGNRLTGWQQVRVTRGIERIPTDFELTMTDPIPGIAQEPFAIGDLHEVYIGDELVCTGYIDRVAPTIDHGKHDLSVNGRGKCADLVDCSAEWQGFLMQNMTIKQIAQNLAKPYGIQVVCDAPGDPIPMYVLQPGESPYSIINRWCQVRALLCYEDEQGNLVLSRGGTAVTAPIVQGQKGLEKATLVKSMDQRYSDYVVIQQGIQLMQDQQGGQWADVYRVQDTQVTRHRLKYLLPENNDAGMKVSMAKAQWEANRRLARGYTLTVTMDSWRDSAGALWQPNTLVPLHIPALNLVDQRWLLGEVTYRLDMTGTHADLLIMPADAFQPEPVLNPVMAGQQDIANAVGVK